jgi:diaminohydroxyphosphoribosylaminopyrimidine deaminase / 5-amino-6-(5-phosphoribosylamino)uracil reductase
MMQSMSDTFFMKRCLQLAGMGAGHAAPNPMVGSVIVHDGTIIGEGYHRRCGEAHAEVHAIESVANKALLPQSTLYVNLEPCAHFGRTPPCADLIVKHGVRRVVIGCVDTFSQVSGKGIARMRQAGITVDVGCLEEESRFINRRFFAFHEKKRPYIILKWAQTQDGFIDILHSDESPSCGVWITNQECKRLVHRWRTEESAILAGTSTLMADNPQLNVREWVGPDPVRIVIDRYMRLPETLAVLDGSSPTIRYSTKPASHSEKYDHVQIAEENFIPMLLADMYQRQLSSVIIEGGATLFSYFIQHQLWDEARVFIGNKWFGHGLRAPFFPYEPHRRDNINGVQLLTFFSDNHSK